MMLFAAVHRSLLALRVIRCAAIFWQLLEAQRTLADAGADCVGRD
jgi:hypothetical protein